MKRLVLDAGPLIALVSEKDNYHNEAKLGFSKVSLLFGEVLTPLPILFEVYKFVYRHESPNIAQKLLSVIQKETVIVTISESDFLNILDLVLNFSHWRGTLEDASVMVIAKKYHGQIWTIDYKDLGFFGDIEFWNP